MTTTEAPTKEECFAAFWDIIAEGLLDLHDKGQLNAPPEPLAEAA